MPHYRTFVRRVGGSYITTVAPEIIRVLGIKPGDPIEWERHGDIAIVKFYRAATTAQIEEEEQRVEGP